MLKRKFSYSIFKRYGSVEASVKKDQNEGISQKLHIFKKKLYATHAQLAKNLVQNSVYNENGLIVLNKPYGLKKEQKEEYRRNMPTTLHPSVSYIDHLNFTGALPELVKSLKVEQLNLVKLPERYISGISILSSEEKVTQRIGKYLRNPLLKPFTYLVLCVGIPKIEENSTRLGITLKIKNNMKKVIFLEKYSTTSAIQQKVFPLMVHHRVLSVNEELNISLLQLTVNRNKWHCVRLFCATNLLAPCLGDWLMGSRIRYINNIPIIVDPFNPVTNSSPIISDKILEALQIKKQDQNSIPLHMHLSQLDLPRYDISGKTFIAEPPEHFLWSCQQLGISVPEFYLQNCTLPFEESLATECE